MKYLQDVIDNLIPTFTKLEETAMPPQDAKKWLTDTLLDAEEHGDVPKLDDVEITWKMVHAFTDIIDQIPEDRDRQQMDDAIYDAAMEVYHQFVDSIANREKVTESSADLSEPPLPKNFWTAARGAEAKHFRTKWMQKPTAELKSSYHSAMSDRHFDLAQRAEKRSDDKAKTFHTKEGNRHTKVLK
jgi:hypothetical protein